MKIGGKQHNCKGCGAGSSPSVPRSWITSEKSSLRPKAVCPAGRLPEGGELPGQASAPLPKRAVPRWPVKSLWSGTGPLIVQLSGHVQYPHHLEGLFTPRPPVTATVPGLWAPRLLPCSRGEGWGGLCETDLRHTRAHAISAAPPRGVGRSRVKPLSLLPCGPGNPAGPCPPPMLN